METIITLVLVILISLAGPPPIIVNDGTPNN
jgi:hypothetical protein